MSSGRALRALHLAQGKQRMTGCVMPGLIRFAHHVVATKIAEIHKLTVVRFKPVNVLFLGHTVYNLSS